MIPATFTPNHLSKLDIINEIAKKYSQDPSLRAVGDTLEGNITFSQICLYFDPQTGNTCAFGHCTKHPEQLRNDSLNMLTTDNTLDQLLKPQYHGHDLKFWEDIQRFHDLTEYWTRTSLSAKGQKHLDQLRNRYKDS